MKCIQRVFKASLTSFTWIFKSTKRTNGPDGTKKEAQDCATCDADSYEFAMRVVLCCVVCLMISILMMLCGGSLGAAELDPKLVIRAVVGEAEGEPYIGKVALAESIRNRGNLKGVYGLRRDLSKVSKKTWRDAERAWRESEHTNLVKGAKHWESTDFQAPTWSEGATVTAHIGKHKFYKGVR